MFDISKLKHSLQSDSTEILELLVSGIYYKILERSAELDARLLENLRKAESTFSETLTKSTSPKETRIGSLTFLATLISLHRESLHMIIQDITERSNDKISAISVLRDIGYGQIQLNSQDLISFYATSRYELYLRHLPFLKRSEIDYLHRLAGEWILAATNYNDTQRLIEAIEDDDDEKLTAEVSKKRSTDVLHPAVLAYENFIDSRLTEDQSKQINRLTSTAGSSYQDQILQIIMSGGKTYILGTLLAFLKADTENLSILMVPKALYTSEASNLSMRTMGAFKSQGFSFNFERSDAKMSQESIAWILESMKNARAEGLYLILPPELPLIIENKVIELEKSEQDDFRLSYIKEILTLFKNHGALTIDEIDFISEPNEELNFPLSGSSSLLSEASGNFLEAKALCEVFYVVISKTSKLQGHDIGKNISLSNEQYETIKKELASIMVDKLLANDLLLPISLEEDSVFAKEKDGWRGTLESFFYKEANIEDQEVVNVLENVRSSFMSNPAAFKYISVIRMAITEWLFIAWNGNVNENYGFSDETIYAIPYSGAQSPKKGSEFTSRWHCYSRTIRTYLVQGLNGKSLVAAIKWMKKLYAQEKENLENEESQERPESETLSIQVFGMKPSDIDLSSEAMIQDLLLKMSDLRQHGESVTIAYMKFLMRWISESLIPGIEFYSQQISSVVYDFDFMFNSIQGYTGTISAVRRLPRKFAEGLKVDLDPTVEAKIKEKLLQDNNYRPVLVDVELSAHEFFKANSEITQVINAMRINGCYNSIEICEKMENNPSPLSAIIDVGAYFKDQKNDDIGKELLVVQNGVLYFSQQAKTKDKLALVTREEPEPVVFDVFSANLIKSAFKCTKTRVTFYDQPRCTGVDIFQDQYGFGLLIIGPKTTARDFYQGAMRMRKLLDHQKIVVVVPKQLEAKIQSSKDKPIELADIITFVENNQRESLKASNTQALFHMIRSFYKEEIYCKSLNLTSKIDPSSLNIWLKDTESSVESLMQPKQEFDLDEFLEMKLDECENMVMAYIDSDELKKIRSKAEAFIGKLVHPKSLEEFNSNDGIEGSGTRSAQDATFLEEPAPAESTKVMGVDFDDQDGMQSLHEVTEVTVNILDSDVLKPLYLTKISTSSVALDTDQIVENTMESNQDMFNYLNVIKHNPDDNADSGMTYLENYLPVFLMKDRQTSKERSRLFSLRGVSTYNLHLSGRNNTKWNAFREKIYLADSYGKKIYGPSRKYVFNCLLLSKLDEKIIVVVPPEDIKIIVQVLKSREYTENENMIFGYNAVLVDPLVGVLLPVGAPDDCLDKFSDLILDVLIMGGYYSELAKDKWITKFDIWIGENLEDRAFRYSMLMDIIITPSEKIDAQRLLLAAKFKIPSTSIEECQNSHDFSLMHFISLNIKGINNHLGRLSRLSDVEHLVKILEVDQINRRIGLISDQQIRSTTSSALFAYISDTKNFSESCEPLECAEQGIAVFLKENVASGSVSSALLKAAVTFVNKFSEYHPRHYTILFTVFKHIKNALKYAPSIWYSSYLLALENQVGKFKFELKQIDYLLPLYARSDVDNSEKSIAHIMSSYVDAVCSLDNRHSRYLNLIFLIYSQINAAEDLKNEFAFSSLRTAFTADILERQGDAPYRQTFDEAEPWSFALSAIFSYISIAQNFSEDTEPLNWVENGISSYVQENIDKELVCVALLQAALNFVHNCTRYHSRHYDNLFSIFKNIPVVLEKAPLKWYETYLDTLDSHFEKLSSESEKMDFLLPVAYREEATDATSLITSIMGKYVNTLAGLENHLGRIVEVYWVIYRRSTAKDFSNKAGPSYYPLINAFITDVNSEQAGTFYREIFSNIVENLCGLLNAIRDSRGGYDGLEADALDDVSTADFSNALDRVYIGTHRLVELPWYNFSNCQTLSFQILRTPLWLYLFTVIFDMEEYRTEAFGLFDFYGDDPRGLRTGETKELLLRIGVKLDLEKH